MTWRNAEARQQYRLWAMLLVSRRARMGSHTWSEEVGVDWFAGVIALFDLLEAQQM